MIISISWPRSMIIVNSGVQTLKDDKIENLPFRNEPCRKFRIASKCCWGKQSKADVGSNKDVINTTLEVIMLK